MIKIRFDNAGNPERPTLLLSSRSGKIIGQLDADDIDIKDSLKESMEMNFVVYKEKNGIVNPYWDQIINFRLIWWKEQDVWFEMTVEFDESEDAIKTIFCSQLGQAELSQINLYNYEINTQNDILRETYSPTVIYNPSNPSGSLLNRLLEKAPHYSVAHVDNSIKNLQRTYTFNNTSIYDALVNVADDIGAIVRVSPIDGETGSVVKRGIAMYDMLCHCDNCGYRSEYLNVGDACPKCNSTDIGHGYGEDTTIFVTRDELAQSIGLSVDVDSVKNCYRLSAGDDLMNATVRNINANNSDYMWYLSGDISADMSTSLRNRLEQYQTLYAERQQGQYNLNASTKVTNYNNLLNKVICRDANNHDVTYQDAYAKYIKYVYSIPDADMLPSGKVLSPISNTISKYNNLVLSYYDTVDFYNFVKTALMPMDGMTKTNATRQCTKLQNRVTKVAVTSLNNVDATNKTPVDSAVLEMAQATLYPGYTAQIISSTFSKTASGGTWVGSLTVTNMSDPEDTHNTTSMSVAVTDDYEEFVLLKIKRTTAQSNVGEVSLDAIFEHNLPTFREDIKQYSLDELTNMMKIAQACTDIIIEQAYEETWAPGGELYNLHADYFDKMNAIIAEQGVRQTELNTVKALQDVIVNAMNGVKSELTLENFLGDALWTELSMYRREDEYSNSNFISDGLTNKELCARAQEFLDEAENSVYKAIEQQYTITTSLNNLLTLDKFAPLLDSFSVGNWIRVLADNRVYKLRLMGYTINFGDISTISVELSEASRSGKGMVGSVSTIQDIVNNATKTVTITYNNDVSPVYEMQLNQTNTTASIASTSAMKSSSDIGGRNILMDTDAPTINKQYAEYNRSFVNSTGTSGNSEYITFSGNSIPPINVTHGARFTISATSNVGARSIRWYSGGSVPMKNAIKYTLSCYARVTSGTSMALWFGYSKGETVGKTYDITNTDWKKYSWKFTYVDSEGNDGPYVYVGCRPTYTGAIEVCGFQLERGETSSDWKQSPEDDAGQSEAIASSVATSLIADFDQKIMARYGVSTSANNVDKSVQISNFVLEEGATVAVQFRNENTKASPTLNVSTTGAHYIRLNKAFLTAPVTTTYTKGDGGTVTNTENALYSGWTANSLVHFMYVKGSGTTDSSSTDHSDDSNMYYWDIVDAAALSKIDNILTQNIVGTNGYINFSLGQFDFGAGKLLFNGTDMKLDGTIYSNAGRIGGWDIGANILQKYTAQPTTSGDQYNIYMQAPTTPSIDQNVSRAFGVQKRTYTNGTAGSWSNVFYVNYKGKLYAKDAEITGTISGSTITGGTINGAHITGSSLNISGTTTQGYEYSLFTDDNGLTLHTHNDSGAQNAYIRFGAITGNISIQSETFTQITSGTSTFIHAGGIFEQNRVAIFGTSKITLVRDVHIADASTVTQYTGASGNLTVDKTITSGGNISAVVSDGTSIKVSAKNSNGEVGVYASTNRGLYDHTRGDWLIYYDVANARTTVKGTPHILGAMTTNSTITSDGSITSAGSICSGGKASVWDSNAGGIMSAGGVLSLRASSSVTPGLYVTAYGSTTTTYDAGFYYNATDTRWQSNKQIYAPSFSSSGTITASGNISTGTTTSTSLQYDLVRNSYGQVRLQVDTQGTMGVYDANNSKWVAYTTSAGNRGPIASTTEAGFMSASDKTKLNALGTLMGTTTGSGGTVSVPGDSTWTRYGSLKFTDAGLWLVIVMATFASNSTGRRGITIDQVTGSGTYTPDAGTAIHTDIRPASATTYVRVVGLVSPAANDEYSINLWSSAGSGTSLTATVRYTCVRLRDN